MLLVGMFDDADSVEEGLERLTEAGLDEEVQRLEEPMGVGSPGGAGASEGGAEPVDMARSPGVNVSWAGQARTAERDGFIGGKVLNDEEREYYRRMLQEGGRLLLVEVDEGRSDEAERILAGAGATRVVRHVH